MCVNLVAENFTDYFPILKLHFPLSLFLVITETQVLIGNSTLTFVLESGTVNWFKILFSTVNIRLCPASPGLFLHQSNMAGVGAAS